jgi:hypothetical protein
MDETKTERRKQRKKRCATLFFYEKLNAKK